MFRKTAGLLSSGHAIILVSIFSLVFGTGEAFFFAAGHLQVGKQVLRKKGKTGINALILYVFFYKHVVNKNLKSRRGGQKSFSWCRKNIKNGEWEYEYKLGQVFFLNHYEFTKIQIIKGPDRPFLAKTSEFNL